jgi:hypothetical protein
LLPARAVGTGAASRPSSRTVAHNSANDKASLLELEDRVRYLANALGDSVAVHRAELYDFQNQQIEGALQQVSFSSRAMR